jgi:hypothetical protein
MVLTTDQKDKTEAIMLIVMSIEDGKIVREPVTVEPEARPLTPAMYPQLQLQILSLPPKAVCPPPPLDIDAFLAAFDA